MNTIFNGWKSSSKPRLKKIEIGSHPNDLIDTISEALLQVYKDDILIDKYDVYQHLMTYWGETMQDDVYMLVVDGWKGVKPLREIIEDKDSKSSEKPDLVVNKKKYKADLIPPDLMIARYFAIEQQEIEKLEAEAETITQQMQELDDEHGGEEGALFDAKSDAGNLTKKGIKDRLKEVKDDPEEAEAIEILQEYLRLIDEEKQAKDQIKKKRAELDEKLFVQYSRLSEEDVKTLVVDDKWLATMATNIEGELDRVSQTLAARIKQLAERYETPLPQLEEHAETYRQKVAAHLQHMGYDFLL